MPFFWPPPPFSMSKFSVLTLITDIGTSWPHLPSSQFGHHYWMTPYPTYAIYIKKFKTIKFGITVLFSHTLYYLYLFNNMKPSIDNFWWLCALPSDWAIFVSFYQDVFENIFLSLLLFNFELKMLPFIWGHLLIMEVEILTLLV